jgi:hypothetical protein
MSNLFENPEYLIVDGIRAIIALQARDGSAATTETAAAEERWRILKPWERQFALALVKHLCPPCESCREPIRLADITAYRREANDPSALPAICEACAEAQAADERLMRFSR